MTGGEQTVGAVRFGRTVLRAVEGRLADQRADAILIAANSRGVLGMGGIGLTGGAEIEREAMARAPLAVGSAIRTGPGLLAGRGVRGVIHTVVTDALGQPARPEHIRRALAAGLRLAEEQRYATVAMPLIGSGTGPAQLNATATAAILVEEIAAHLRRVSSRIEQIALVARVPDDVATIDDLLRLARDQAWELPR
jgi:O-acetyl-ADP-ribose deacetylase